MSFDLVFEVDIATRVYFYLRRICQQTYSDTRSFVTNHKIKRDQTLQKMSTRAVYEPGFVKTIQKNILQKNICPHMKVTSYMKLWMEKNNAQNVTHFK